MFIGFPFYIHAYTFIMGRQLDRIISFWQPASILHSVVILILLWRINTLLLLFLMF